MTVDTTIDLDRRARDPRFARQPDRRGRRRPRRRLRRPGGRPVGRLDRAPTRRSSSATATRPGTAARASSRPSPTSSSAIAPELIGARRGRPGRRRRGADRPRRHARTRRELGANAILGVSLACAHAAAGAARPAALPLPRRGRRADPAGADVQHPQRRQARPGLDRLPGVHGHAGRRRHVHGDALRAGAEIFDALRAILHAEGHATGQGDEGGFAPSLPSNEAAVEVILRAIEKAGYRPGEDVAIALDPATSSILVEGTGDRRRDRPLPPGAARAGPSTPAS